MMSIATKTYKVYIVVNNCGVPLYPTLSTSRKGAIDKMVGDYSDNPKQEWAYWKSQGYSVERCELTFTAKK